MKRLLLLLLPCIFLCGMTIPYPQPQPPPYPNYAYQCSAHSETGEVFYSRWYTFQNTAQQEAVNQCMQAGARQCTVYQCFKR